MPSALLKRELFLSFSTYGTTVLGISFFITVIVVSALGFNINPIEISKVGPSLIWTTVLLSIVITSDNLIKDDFRDGSLDLLLTSPIPLELILIIKALAHWISVSCPIILLTPILAIIFNIAPQSLYWLLMGLFLGTPALSFTAVFGASLTFSLKRSSVLLPIIIIPLYIPTLVFGVKIINSTNYESGDSINGILTLSAVSLFCISIMPFAASFGIRSSIK